MQSPYFTAKEAAAYLNVKYTTFFEKARDEWKLVPVQVFAGPKGKRYKRAEVEAVARRADAERDQALKKAREAVAKATGRTPLRMAG